MFPILKVQAALAFFFILLEKSEAATTFWQFEVTINSASPTSSVVTGDTFLGQLSYDSTTAPTIAAPDLELEFQFAGEFFDNSDDTATGYPLFLQEPETALTFCVDLESREFDTGSFFHIYPDNSFQYSLDGVSEYEGSITFQPIPEPSPLALLLSSSVLIILFKRQRR